MTERTVHEVITMLSGPRFDADKTIVMTTPMFSPPLRIIWGLLFSCTITSELVPIPGGIPASALYGYVAAKGVLFFLPAARPR